MFFSISIRTKICGQLPPNSEVIWWISERASMFLIWRLLELQVCAWLSIQFLFFIFLLAWESKEKRSRIHCDICKKGAGDSWIEGEKWEGAFDDVASCIELKLYVYFMGEDKIYILSEGKRQDIIYQETCILRWVYFIYLNWETYESCI